MGSKSVLILGIVFIFLLNVIAVHNYIDNYYYQPEKLVIEKDNTPLLNTIKEKNAKIIEKKLKNEELVEYKSNYYNQIVNAKKESEWLKKELDKAKNNKDNKISKIIKKDKNKKNDIKDTIENKAEKDAFIVLNLNINEPYQKGNQIIKKMVKGLDNSKVIKIKIYKYSMKIKDYLKEIKDDIVDYGVDVDSIKVIYKKDEKKKDKIKILLTKKD